MRTAIIILCATLGASAANAGDLDEPHFAPFEVTQSSAPTERTVAGFEFAGAPVEINAYGREARARATGALQESNELRKLSGAFDRASGPAVVTIEARISF